MGAVVSVSSHWRVGKLGIAAEGSRPPIWVSLQYLSLHCLLCGQTFRIKVATSTIPRCVD